MDGILPIYEENDVKVKLRSIFTINEKLQVVFMTDFKTGKKLDDDYNVNEYLKAVIQSNLLNIYGISSPEQLFSIVRSENIDGNKTTAVLDLDVITNEEEGVDELRCVISEEGFAEFYSEVEEPPTPEDSCLSWSQQVPELCAPLNISTDVASGPTLRWNTEMTTQLITIRGNMDLEFARAKYKFHLWEKVAMKLNEVLINMKVSAKDCDDKWRNIVATYRKNIDKMKYMGDNSIRWEYFNAMDKILKGSKEPTPDLVEPLYTEEPVSRLMNSITYIDADSANSVLEASFSDEQSPIEEIEIDELEEMTQDTIITRKPNGEKRRWTVNQCLMLFNLRHKAEQKFSKSHDGASLLWKDLAGRMNSYFLSDFRASELESVWNHCSINYKINLENLKSKGVSSISWKYFAVMDEMFEGTKEIADLCVPRPGENLLKDYEALSQRSLDAPNQSTNSGFNPLISLNGEEETDTDDTFSPYSGIIWTQDLVNLLISLKRIIEQDIAKHKIPKKKQWWSMVRRFRSLKHVKVTEEGCEEKWRNLVRTYKKNLIRVRNRGTGVIRWPYFWKMHEILGNMVPENEKSLSIPFLEVPGNIMYDSIIPDVCVGTIPTTDQITSNRQLLEGTMKEQHETLSNMISDLREKQNRILQEVVDRQNKKIEELYQEQLNIKTLLTQLLGKFP